MKFGCTIPFDIFKKTCSENSRKLCECFGGRDNLLGTMGKEVEAVELNAIWVDTDKDELYQAVSACSKCGLYVTFHGTLEGIREAKDFYEPYLRVLHSGIQSSYNITVHPLEREEDTESVLREICNMADAMNYPVCITLENQRYTNESSKRRGCKSVAEAVRRISSGHLGICFDFGHQLSNVKKHGQQTDEANTDFISLVKHTHIHSCYEGTTHFPLTCGETALEENLTKLYEGGYDGILSLELHAARFLDQFDGKASLLNSISVLKAASAQIDRKIKMIKEYESHYEEHLARMSHRLKNSRCGMGAVGPAAYVIKLGNAKIAVDPSLSQLPVCAEDRQALIRLLEDFDGVIITHGHHDHFDKEILKGLPAKVKIFMPDFMAEECSDVENPSIIWTKAEYETMLQDVRMTFFEGCHSVTGSYVPEYGFALTYKGERYVFPTDVRNYDPKDHRIFTDTKVLIAHLWLGRENALNLYHNAYVEEFCRFVNSYHAEKVFIAHLYDVRRKIEDMWTDIHFDAVRQRIENVDDIKLGDWIEL